MDNERIHDEDRVSGERLTPEEIEDLRRDLKEGAAFVRAYFRANPSGQAAEDQTR